MAGGHAWQILRDAVNEWAVRILLECILVTADVYESTVAHCHYLRTHMADSIS